jgi:hypothetical protein
VRKQQGSCSAAAAAAAAAAGSTVCQVEGCGMILVVIMLTGAVPGVCTREVGSADAYAEAGVMAWATGKI